MERMSFACILDLRRDLIIIIIIDSVYLLVFTDIIINSVIRDWKRSFTIWHVSSTDCCVYIIN